MRSISSALGKMAAVTVAFLLVTSLAANAQDAAPKSSADKAIPAPPSMGDTKKPEKKVSLKDAAPVTTEEAARRAAREKGQSSATKKDDKPADGTVDSVLEFKPASPEEQAAAKSDLKPAAKQARKNIHGETYGGLNPTSSGTHQEGGSTGATSKDGKTSVYIQGDQTRSVPTPH